MLPIGTTTGRSHRTVAPAFAPTIDRKSTRLNSSHEWISYAVFCLKKKKKMSEDTTSRCPNLAATIETEMPQELASCATEVETITHHVHASIMVYFAALVAQLLVTV